MDQDDYGGDPFSSEGLWRLSKFTLLSLQPLEPLPWNEELPGKYGPLGRECEELLTSGTG